MEIGRPALLVLAVVRQDRGEIPAEGGLQKTKIDHRRVRHRRDMFVETKNDEKNRRRAMQLIDHQQRDQRIEDRRIEFDVLLMEFLREMKSSDSKAKGNDDRALRGRLVHSLEENLFVHLRASEFARRPLFRHLSQLLLELAPEILFFLAFDDHQPEAVVGSVREQEEKEIRD